MIDTVPSSTAVQLGPSPGVSELKAISAGWIDRKAKRGLHRSYFATLRSTMRGFVKVSKARTFSDLKPRHLPAYLRARAK